jgi:hypothetical protein
VGLNGCIKGPKLLIKSLEMGDDMCFFAANQPSFFATFGHYFGVV